MKSPIILALDGLSRESALSIVCNTSELVWGYKVHDILFREGLSFITELKQYGNVFVDFKFHDIPTTVGYEVSALKKLGADLISVHASGGGAMLKAAVNAGGDTIAAITLLSSFSEEEVQKIYDKKIETLVEESVERAHAAGIRSVVCSPHEIELVRGIAPDSIVITPGIREHTGEDDQVRSTNALDARRRGADLLVIGRPITKAPNPRTALEQILKTLT